ncbi:MAG TPA: stage IV sporulation protein A [Candidatus Copromorpha excrementigallinarum]|uniref:Stage IV sporulation protein A n=1 Tax=Candidatus Allocopromorpha excrementigallinarum TaxID=2840742 RepID=A0A9D1L6B2_9FIRM|nr:stage IV sporulation protein A [Candidatus Copromorpha excrementigallinarum]
MENINIYENIGKRTGGDIYIGVVGPVRAGKSTFIKRFMDLMVIPNVKNTYEKQRIMDEMPQSGAGRTITTTEPKFIPAEAVRLELGEAENMEVRVRLVDCVGYMIPGAIGHMEDGEPRMVATPWDEEKIPFTEAAEIGTEKVIKDHSTVGVVITSDGTTGAMERSSYTEAEERVIRQLEALRKPFIVILNSTEPASAAARDTAAEMADKYGVPVTAADCARISEKELSNIMVRLLDRFPVKEIKFKTPGYVEGLDKDHWLKKELIENIRAWAQTFNTVEELKKNAAGLADGEIVKNAEIKAIDMGTGEVNIRLDMEEELYYKVITELMDEKVENDYEFFSLLREFAKAKKEYDKLKGAIAQVEERGYGIVEPKLSEMILEEPEVFRQGNKYGVKITAKAPTLHIIKTDITTEVSPVVGSEKQSEDLAASLREDMEKEPNGIWDTNIFGKSLYEMVAEQMENKIAGVPDNIRVKMQKSLQKISDEGKEYFICIVI